MIRSRKKRRRFQFSLASLLGVCTTICISLALFRYAGFFDNFVVALDNFKPWAVYGGLILLGGAIGAPIGQVFQDERGGMALMGAYLGALMFSLLGFLILDLGFSLFTIMRF